MTDWPVDVTFVEGSQALHWIDSRLRSGKSIGSFVPTGFEDYVRVLHPAARRDIDSGEWRAVRWKEVAERYGVDLRPDSLFKAICGSRLGEEIFPLAAPYQGFLDDETCGSIVEILSSSISLADSCFFALWRGYAGIDDAISPVSEASLTGKSYVVVSGAIDLACRLPFTPSYWWPVDRSWVVATGLDQDSTIISCNSVIAQMLLADDRLEALMIAPDAILRETDFS